MSARGGTIVLGGSGLVGRELVHYFECPSTSFTTEGGFDKVDATKPADLRSYLERRSPEVVINCVGLADVDRAERDPSLAESLNCDVVANLANASAELGFHLVHISTDYVFDGSRGFYRETDPPNPINVYGRSKLRGEREAHLAPEALVLRISAPFGCGRGTRKTQFFRYVTENLRSGKRVKALTDQRVTATYLPDLAHAVETLLSKRCSGTFHIGSREPLTRYEFARMISRVLGTEPRLVVPAARAEMTQWLAPRPVDTSLDVGLSQEQGIEYTPVETALRTLLQTEE